MNSFGGIRDHRKVRSARPALYDITHDIGDASLGYVDGVLRIATILVCQPVVQNVIALRARLYLITEMGVMSVAEAHDEAVGRIGAAI